MAQTVLVTGASGFLGAHIVNAVLAKGYRVRATARAAKAEALKKAYAKHGDRFEVAVISNIDKDQFPEALVGLHAIIHSASALAGNEPTNEALLDNTIAGTLNLVKQAEKAGIKNIVVVSSIATVVPNPKMSFTDQDWHPATRESTIAATPMGAYRGAKTLAEKALWEFAEAHPHLEITTLNPPYLYGPFAEEYILPPPNSGLSTNHNLQNLLLPTGLYTPSPAYSDVRDVAKALVAAINSPPTSQVGRKRILYASPHGIKWGDILELIRQKRPELKDRLITSAPPEFPYDRAPVNFERIEQVLGIKKEDFYPRDDTILGAIDSIVKTENEWVKGGAKVEIAKLDLL